VSPRVPKLPHVDIPAPHAPRAAAPRLPDAHLPHVDLPAPHVPHLGGRREPARRYAHVAGWGAYAPPLVLTNHDLETIVDTSDEWITSRTGIRERRIAGWNETTASLAAVAGRRAIAVAGLEPVDIDLIVVATLTPDYWMPSTAALVKQAIGAEKAAAMDVAAACSGFVYAYSVAHAQIVAGLAQHVLVVGAEVLSRFLDYADRNTCVLFGDGAGAVVLSVSTEPGGAKGFELTTDPAGAYKIWLPAGGGAAPASGETVAGRGHYLRMEGRETYRYATRTIATTALTAIDRAGWAPELIDLLVPHQANLRIIESVSKGLGFPMERIFINLDRYGNTSAASVPIALAEAVDAGRVHPGDRIVFVAFGAGFTSGAVAMEWTADPAAAARAAGIGPGDVPVVIPDDWDSVGPVPEVLVRAFAAKGIDVTKAGAGTSVARPERAGGPEPASVPDEPPTPDPRPGRPVRTHRVVAARAPRAAHAPGGADVPTAPARPASKGRPMQPASPTHPGDQVPDHTTEAIS
jgi:3-oxoacyl-[acyl-carrier-protein] synthase-3